MKGRFITVEGGDGAGKSTNLSFIHQYLLDAAKDVVLTREPGGTPLGEQIRSLLLDHKQAPMCDEAELLLMFAARAQHINEVIRPALDVGKWVLSDRFTDATYAYQGGGRGISGARIGVIEDWVQGPLRPDLTILLDIPVELGLVRAGNRSSPDRFELEQKVFFERVRQAYLDIARQNPKRVKVVDASQSLNDVQQSIKAVLTEFCSTAV
jgi:dTMP kinase